AASTTLTATGTSLFNAGTDVGLSVAGTGIPAQATITAVGAGGTTATISVATTAASPAPVPPATGATIGLGKTLSFTDAAVATGPPAFPTGGTNAQTATMGVTQAPTSTVTPPTISVAFGGAAGVGPSTCLMTGSAGPAPGTPGPAQTGETTPALPFGTPGTTPLVLATGGFITQPGTTQAITPPAAAFVALGDAPPVANSGTVSLGVGGTKTITLSATDTDPTPVTACNLVGTPSLPRLAVSISNAPTPCSATLT